MDPNEALRRLLETAREIGNEPGDLATDREVHFAEDFEALHTWIVNGGFLPAAWVRK
jgi:hypothetical protein